MNKIPSPKPSIPLIYTKRKRPTESEAFRTYWNFAVKRQDAYFARISGDKSPWSDDPVISEYKFTNCYRAADRVSQFLIKDVIYSDDWSLENTVFRTLLFKVFNKIETWKLLQEHFGEICLETFDPKAFDKALLKAIETKRSIYSAAYIIPSGSKERYAGLRKHSFHLNLIDKLMKNKFSQSLSEKKTMQEAYSELLKVESFGQFLAYQFVTDLNYSNWFNFSENEYVVPGPGARDGIRKCFNSLGDFNEVDVIEMMADEQEKQFERFGLEFKSLWGRDLKLIDCQNLFCEVDKYSRIVHPEIKGISGRTKIKQKFKPNIKSIEPWYPPKWGINEKVSEFLATI